MQVAIRATPSRLHGHPYRLHSVVKGAMVTCATTLNEGAGTLTAVILNDG
jgi:hypothetical protein